MDSCKLTRSEFLLNIRPYTVHIIIMHSLTIITEKLKQICPNIQQNRLCFLEYDQILASIKYTYNLVASGVNMFNVILRKDKIFQMLLFPAETYKSPRGEGISQ